MVLQTLFYGGYLLSTGQVGAGDLMAFLASSTIVQRSLQNMSLLISQVVKGTTAAARVSQVRILSVRFGELIPDMKNHYIILTLYYCCR